MYHETHQVHCKTTAQQPQAPPRQPPFQEARPPQLRPGPGLTAHTRHTLSRLPCGLASEAEFDIQKEVNHVLFMMNEANITRITSPQISLSSSEMKTMASSPPPSLPLEDAWQDELSPQGRAAWRSRPVKKAPCWHPLSPPTPCLVPGPGRGSDTQVQAPRPEPWNFLEVRKTSKVGSILKRSTPPPRAPCLPQDILRGGL